MQLGMKLLGQDNKLLFLLLLLSNYWRRVSALGSAWALPYASVYGKVPFLSGPVVVVVARACLHNMMEENKFPEFLADMLRKYLQLYWKVVHLKDTSTTCVRFTSRPSAL